MWVAAKRTFVGSSALLGVLLYALQFQKACGESTPYQCVSGFVGWARQGLLAPRQDSGGSPKQGQEKAPAPSEPAAVVPAPPRSVPAQPSAKGSNFTVVNSGHVTLLEFFATRCSINNWGRDLLGTDVIPAGERHAFNLDTEGTTNCCYDLRARFEDGRQRMNMGVNVCTVGTWGVGSD